MEFDVSFNLLCSAMEYKGIQTGAFNHKSQLDTTQIVEEMNWMW